MGLKKKKRGKRHAMTSHQALREVEEETSGEWEKLRPGRGEREATQWGGGVRCCKLAPSRGGAKASYAGGCGASRGFVFRTQQGREHRAVLSGFGKREPQKSVRVELQVSFLGGREAARPDYEGTF